MAAARLFVDRRESTVQRSGGLLDPVARGCHRREHIRGEIGELLLGRCAGRTSPEEITVFKSLGLAVEDLAAAQLAAARAREAGRGTWVEL
jgi:ornithine cyclodeaminase/alanine dehydrogenase-like protein (mu-crystallin family)